MARATVARGALLFGVQRESRPEQCDVVDPDHICAGPDRIETRSDRRGIERGDIVTLHTERPPNESLAARSDDDGSTEPDPEVATVP
jgi:hypothetical protein